MRYDVIIIGGGPAGLGVAIKASERGKRALIIEREKRLGGILKQCVHDGFGLLRFGEKLTGPEYAHRDVVTALGMGAEALTGSFVISITKKEGEYFVSTTSERGLRSDSAPALVFATGCRERTARQVNIHGTRPAGVLTAGSCQHLVNLKGLLPGKKAVILGSGDIGLIMARRLTLEGAEVAGVFEAKGEPGGLQRNIRQCLDDYGIPLRLKTTVVEVYGDKRVEAVRVAPVDDNMRPVSAGEIIPCDLLVVSVGLIPENELQTSLGLTLENGTRGVAVDQYMMCVDREGVYVVGNALHVHDLVDFVTEGAMTAGSDLGSGRERQLIKIDTKNLSYIVPQYFDVSAPAQKSVFYMRSPRSMRRGVLKVFADGVEVLKKRLVNVRPPEMIRLECAVAPVDSLEITLEEESV